MRMLVRSMGSRVIPGVLIALGVTLVTAGMFTYASPVEQGPVLDQPPTVVSLITPAPSTDPLVPPSGDPNSTFTPGVPLPAVLPVGWPTDTSSNRVATRVVVRELRIDLPVIQGTEAYPACGVAMYFTKLGQPGGGRAIYLYAHARTGMFLPILDASKIRNGEKMLGMIADVYTSDDLVLRYKIVEVRRHQVSLSDAYAVQEEQLWLQTSEGPRGTAGKTQVIGVPYSADTAAHSEAHPTPHPYRCG